MRNFILCVVLLVVAGCAGGNGEPLHLEPSFSATADTPAGVAIEASDEIAASEEFQLALLEVDAVVQGFANGLLPYQLTLRGVRFVGHGEEAESMRAKYVGAGIVEACIHEDRRPVIFCLPGAFAQMAREQNPGIEEWRVRDAVTFATWNLASLYPEANLRD